MRARDEAGGARGGGYKNWEGRESRVDQRGFRALEEGYREEF